MTQKTGPKNDLFWAKKLYPFCLGYVAVELSCSLGWGCANYIPPSALDLSLDNARSRY